MQRFQAWKKLVEEGPMKTSSRFEVYQRVRRGIAELIDFIQESGCDCFLRRGLKPSGRSGTCPTSG
jgi:hypothetical protein